MTMVAMMMTTMMMTMMMHHQRVAQSAKQRITSN
jgi:hypothetical protein